MVDVVAEDDELVVLLQLEFEERVAILACVWAWRLDFTDLLRLAERWCLTAALVEVRQVRRERVGV
jgi:hypothetical protein